MNIAFSLPKEASKAAMYRTMFVDMVIRHFPLLKVVGLEKSTFKFSENIHNAGAGAIVVIDDSNEYDVDWYANEEKAKKDGVNTILNIETSMDAVSAFLDNYYKNVVLRNRPNGGQFTETDMNGRHEFQAYSREYGVVSPNYNGVAANENDCQCYVCQSRRANQHVQSKATNRGYDRYSFGILSVSDGTALLTRVNIFK